MAPYFALLLIPSLFSIFNATRVRPILFYFVALLFVVFVGLRFRVGTDWGNYEYIHGIVVTYDFADIFRDTEPASYFLFWISANYFDGTLLTNIVAAIITLFGIFVFARSTPHPWISVVSATPYLIIVFSMTGIRQAMAVGVMLFILSRWQRIGPIKQSLFIIIASLFHTSALINFLFVIFNLRVSLLVKLSLIGAFGVVGAAFASSLFFYSDNIAFYQDAYLTAEQSIISPGALIHVALIWMPAATFLLLRRRLSPHVPNARLLHTGSWLTLLLLVVYFFASTVASRMTLYLYFVPMMLYPAFIHSFMPKMRPALTVLIVLMHFGILAMWLLFANNAIPHIPYRNVLFELQESPF